jgi:regulator of replication initiation timing
LTNLIANRRVEARRDKREERINLFDEVESLSNELRELRAENRSIIAENRRLAQENQMLAGEAVRLRTEAERLRTEVNMLSANAERLRLDLVASGTATQQMTARMSELQGTADRLGRQVEDLRAEVIRLTEVKRVAAN